MRDKKRIKRIMSKLTKLWEKVPDWRFYQFLINLRMVQDDNNLWHLEDKDVEEHIDNQKAIENGEDK